MASKPAGEGHANTARRDELLRYQKEAQKRWQEDKLFEVNAPAEGEVWDAGKFFGTFPYPYMNGMLHLGHAFSLSKLEFACAFHRLCGKKVLFPQGFHCTGMPIKACADKLERELQLYCDPDQPGSLPVFPAEEPDAAAAEAEVEAVAEQGPRDPGASFKGKKSKAAAKQGTAKRQWEILRDSGIPEAEIAEFRKTSHWLRYFPPLAMRDMTAMGCGIDWRRTFITTDVNQYYDSFVQWQFRVLKRQGRVYRDKRYAVYSPLDKQPCADHDRASGEGANPQEYILGKLKALELTGKLAALEGQGSVYFLTATLRSETFYGVTNAWVLPEGQYGAFRGVNHEIYIMSHRSALNLSYQDRMPVTGQPECLMTVSGQDLIGTPLKAPRSPHERVYALPLLTIKMNKGTGVVMGCPSDSPDDYTALNELKAKPAFRQKFQVQDAWVEFDVLPVMEVPGLGNMAAKTLCDDWKIKTQGDKKLEEAKKIVYLKGFNEGVMVVGNYTGRKEDAPVQPVALELVPLSPYLKPTPLPDLPQVPRAPKRQEQPKKDKSGFAILCGALLHLVVLLGAAWGSWTSQHSMPMMPLYHQHISHESAATAPYMYSGGFTARPIAATYQYASSMLPRSAPAQQAAPLPSIAEIQQAFHDARQQAPPHVETEFSHNVVTAMRDNFVLDTAREEDADLISSVQQDGSDNEGLPVMAPAQSLIEDDEDAHVEGSSLGDAGSGASWKQDESSGLEANLRHSWGRAMSAARAVVSPISFFWQGDGEQPHGRLHAHADHAENNADLSSHEAYSAYPVAATAAFSKARREARQQAASMAGKLTSTFRSAADAAAFKRALNSLQTVTKSPATALRHSWGVVSHRLSQIKSAVSISSREDANSSASSFGGSADSMPPPTHLSSAADAKDGSASDTARDLADASADLMQSLDNLLESLEGPQADIAMPDASSSDSVSAHQARAQPAEFESEAASGTSSATLVHDGRTEPGNIGLQQHAPRFQGFVDERPSPSTHVHTTAEEGSSRSWASLLHAAKPLIAIVAATTGMALLAQLFLRSHLGGEEAEELASPERRRSVSRRLSASFSAMQNAASGADAVSSVAAASAAVEAAEEAEYSIGHKAVTQLPQSKTPARPRGTAAETEHPRGQYLLRSREVTQVGSHAHQQAIGEVSSKSTVRRSSRHKQ